MVLKKYTLWLAMISCLSMLACTPQATTLPEFSARTLTQQSYTRADFANKITVLHFWATSCKTCIEEMPKLKTFYQGIQSQYLERVAFLSVTMPYDPPNYVINYQKTQHLPFDIAMDVDGNITKAFNVQVTPTLLVFNQQGVLVHRIIGEPDWAALNKSLADMQKQS